MVPVQVEPDVVHVQAEFGVVPVHVEPGVVSVQAEPEVALVQVEPGVVSGPTGLSLIVPLVLEQGVFALVDTSVLVVLGWDEAPGHHIEISVGQDELGSVAYQDAAVGGTEKINIPHSGIVLFVLQCCGRL
jgi:hypothetical protein